MCDPKQGQAESLCGIIMHLAECTWEDSLGTTHSPSYWLPSFLASFRKPILAGESEVNIQEKQKTRETPIEKFQAALSPSSNIWGPRFWMPWLQFYTLPQPQDPSHLQVKIFSMCKMFSGFVPSPGNTSWLINPPFLLPQAFSFPFPFFLSLFSSQNFLRLSGSLIHWPFLPTYLSLVFIY